MRNLFIVFSLCFLMMPPIALAQMAGSSCSTFSGGHYHESGTETLVCDSGTWKPVISFDNSGKIGFQVGNDSAGCTTNKTGRMRFTSTTSTWEYCDGSTWTSFPVNSVQECNVLGKSIGYVCPDGSIFIGFSPDAANQQPLYASRCDAGQTWSGSACTGTRASLAWGSSGTTRSTTDALNGKAQTTTLAAFGSTAHPAASYCQDLSMHGKTDWYLPAVTEALRIIFSQSSISGFSTAQQYLTSTEVDSTQAFTVNPTAQGGVHNQAKTTTTFHIRCIRRD